MTRIASQDQPDRLRNAEGEIARSGIRPGDLYIHNKIRDNYPNVVIYEIICLCVNESDLVPCVVYRSLSPWCQTWCRPLEEFRVWVEVGKDGEQMQMPRFVHAGRATRPS